MRQLIFSFIIVSLAFIACKDNSKLTTETTTSDVPSATSTTTEIAPAALPQENAVNSTSVTAVPATNTTTPAPQPTAQKEPAQNAKGVWHFTCPKGCKGGGGAVGPCGKCGATLAHNAAYHEGAPTQLPTVNSAPSNSTPLVTPVTQPTQKVEPAQNAKGVWHFTCAKGCAGGAGAAGTCGKCGGALAHNAAYHQ